MKFVTIRQLQNQMSSVFSIVSKKEDDVIITKNGVPSMFLLPITEDNFEDTIEIFRQLKLEMTIKNMQVTSYNQGNQKMMIDEINNEIAASRKKRL